MMDGATQGTDEWLAERAGCVTASRISDVMAKGRGGQPSATRANYMAQLACEILTGLPTESFTSGAMQWGTDHEDQARASYTLETGRSVVETGFVPHLAIGRAGASPDGLVGEDGLVEIKCPNTATHIATLRGAGIDRKYLLQMQWQMICTGRDWCDFVSFDPRLPGRLSLYVERVDADAEMQAEIILAVTWFLADLDEMLADLAELEAA